jgi:GT2 family glycosyltransferase
MLKTSTSLNSRVKPGVIDKGKKLLEETLERRGIEGEILETNIDHFFRIKRKVIGKPLISIIIAFKDKPELLLTCIGSILKKTTYSNYEIIGISNNSEDRETFKAMESLQQLDSRVSFYEYNIPFNYSKINNHAVFTYAKGEHIILLNNDIEIISEDWIDSMLEHSQRDEVGCVGAKLYYPNDTIQHAGVIIGIGGVAGHSHKGFSRSQYGYFFLLTCIQNVSSVTGACLMIKKNLYEEFGGFNEFDLPIAFNDIDFCLRLIKAGYLNIFTPYAEAYHHESVTRGYEDTKEKVERFQGEVRYMLEKHADYIGSGDPYYNPNLTLEKEDFSLKN